MSASLEVQALRKSHGPQRVLHGVDLHVPGGQVLALLGQSGCGKTTLLRAIAGFEAPDSGRIALGDREMTGPGVHLPAERRRIGYVPQEGTLFPHLSLLANVSFGLDRASRRAGRAAAAIAITGLTGLEARYPHQLSGGQQQRTALARALAPEPGLMLLDEPFNALDIGLRRSVCEEVVRVLRASGTTAVLVTHDPMEAFASADLVAVMRAGTVAQCADGATVYRRPADAGVARLTGPVLFLPASVRGDMADTPLGPVPVVPGGCGGTATVMLRPEQVVSAPGGRGARTVRQAFRGDHTLAVVVLGGREMEVRLPGFQEVGETVELAVLGPGVAFPPE